MKEQTWFVAADSAKGTLVTGVEADETVEVVAPCIMGTFIQASQTKDEDEEDMDGEEGEQEWYGYHGKMRRFKSYGTSQVIVIKPHANKGRGKENTLFN